MGEKGLLSLPPELLRRIYAYLDWDRSTQLIPTRDGLFTISLTCKHLRASVVPLLFRNVTLSLRWADGTLLEPNLYRLRSERPDLAQHVRCVCISTKRRDRTQSESQPPFRMPGKDVKDWLSLERVALRDDKHYTELFAAYREQVNEVARALFRRASEASGSNVVPQVTAEELVRQMVRWTSSTATGKTLLQPGKTRTEGQVDPGVLLGTSCNPYGDISPLFGIHELELQVDSLAIVMLCVPALLTELVFVPMATVDEVSLPNRFATEVAAAALKVCNQRLDVLTVASSRRCLFKYNWRNALSDPVADQIFAGLTKLKKLTIAASAGSFAGNSSSIMYPNDQLCTQRLRLLPASTLETIEFCDMSASKNDADDMMKLAQHFTPLRSVTFRNVCFMGTGQRSRLRPPPAHLWWPATISETAWLQFAIELRRALPTADITFAGYIEVRPANEVMRLSDSALKWLQVEAIPVGARIGLGREERLYEDFESFLPLWQAEESPRGRQAAGEWVTQRGELVDLAMCSRWQTFGSMRKV